MKYDIRLKGLKWDSCTF